MAAWPLVNSVYKGINANPLVNQAPLARKSANPAQPSCAGWSSLRSLYWTQGPEKHLLARIAKAIRVLSGIRRGVLRHQLAC